MSKQVLFFRCCSFVFSSTSAFQWWRSFSNAIKFLIKYRFSSTKTCLFYHRKLLFRFSLKLFSSSRNQKNTKSIHKLFPHRRERTMRIVQQNVFIRSYGLLHCFFSSVYCKFSAWIHVCRPSQPESHEFKSSLEHRQNRLFTFFPRVQLWIFW